MKNTLKRFCVCRKGIGCLLLLAVYAISGFGTAAEVPYNNYCVTEWATDAAAPVAYTPQMTVKRIEAEKPDFLEPQDLYIRDGEIYVLDSGNSRIVVLDSNLQLIRVIGKFTGSGGETLTLNKAQSLFVDEKHDLYIADTENSRVLKVDGTGKLLQTFVKPTSAEYTTKFFKPKKVVADPDGTVFVIAEGVYQGALVFEPDGKFKSFFGSARVQASVKLIADRLWKQLLSNDQRSKMSQYVPVEFSNFDIDDEGLIYTCTSFTSGNREQVRKLNYLGNNIYPYTENFGEKDIVGYKQSTYITSFVDVCVNESDILYALDNTRGRIYTFDQEGNRLLVFGNISDQMGGFRTPVAIDTLDSRVYVLDYSKGSITCFLPTEYGQKILEAVSLYHHGLYEEALAPWQEVLKMNSNFELGYSGMGQAMMKLGNYEKAVEYFRLGYDRANESKAFEKYRNAYLRSHTTLVISVLVLVVLFLVIVTSKCLSQKVFRRKRTKKPEERGMPK